jgi:outer membrane receptor protein involved in Fe transport
MDAPRPALVGQLAVLLGSASLLAMANVSAYAQSEAAVAEEQIPETVLITGSLIRGTTSVGAPVANFTPRDFVTTGALTTGDLFRSFPAANVSPGPVATESGANTERGVKVNIRGLDSGSAIRSLLMVDGMRFPAQARGLDYLDPSIIPALSMERIDVLVDGASATYGSDAISGVINIILKRNMDGAITQARWTTAAGGKNRYAASAVWGRTWEGGQITLSYEWYNESEIKGNAHSELGVDHTPWGFDDRTPLASSAPATLSVNTPRALGGGPNVGTSAQLGHGCVNCYAVPSGAGQNWEPGSNGIGPTAPFSAPTFDWLAVNMPANSGSNGVRNQFDPYDMGWYDAAQERNGGHITVDQRLTANISFYGSGFYSNRRAKYLSPSNWAPAVQNLLFNIGVPTFNPYYPSSAPDNLRVNYNIGVESPAVLSSYELAQRYQLGLNIALPAGWNGRVWYAMTNDQSNVNGTGTVNKNAVSAALGWTLNTTRAAGTTPAIATWTKPSSVPYLNLFCDASAYSCNSDETIAYIGAIRYYNERYWINEKGATFDGPLFDLPAGTVKAAVGATYTTFRFQTTQLDNSAGSLIVPYGSDAQGRQVWAVFAQINAPIFSEINARPLLRRLELEFSWRHDQYSDFGGTSNPKVAFNWAPIADFTIRGTWGTSFRAPGFSELSPLNDGVGGYNLGGLAAGDVSLTTGCTVGGALPPAGSGAWKIQSSAGDGTIGSGTVCVQSLLNPQGISANGPAAVTTIRPQDQAVLHAEQATNWGIGFDYTPDNNFLSGLNIQATYYAIKLSGAITGFTNASFTDPRVGDFLYRVPTDWASSGLPGAAGCTNNLLPTTCAPFQEAVATLIGNPRSTVDPQARTLILFIHDAALRNQGWRKLDGIDWSLSYDWEWGELGLFNAGILGTYYLHDRQQATIGAPIADTYHTTNSPGLVNEAQGVNNLPRLRYRARLGWARGQWSLTAFADYIGSYYHNQQPPPNVNGNFCTANGGLDEAGNGGTYPCAIQDYTNVLPAYATFDLSLGYNTMDAPSNEYLRNIGVQLVVQNVLDKHGQYQYRIGTGGGNPCTCDIQKSLQGRTISLIVTKQW